MLPKPHPSPRDPARTRECYNIQFLNLHPATLKLHADPPTISGLSPDLIDTTPRTKLVHNRTFRWHHAREKLDSRAPERGIKCEANPRWRKPPSIPYFVLICCERIRRGTRRRPPPEGVGFGGAAAREHFGFWGF